MRNPHGFKTKRNSKFEFLQACRWLIQWKQRNPYEARILGTELSHCAVVGTRSAVTNFQVRFGVEGNGSAESRKHELLLKSQ